MRKQPIFKKHLYLQVHYFSNDKLLETYYIKSGSNNFKVNNKTYLLNPEHIFITKNFKTVIVNSISSETLNPLNFKSRFNSSEFNSAINNKLISETFETIKDNKLELTQLLLIANIVISTVLLFLVFKGGI